MSTSLTQREPEETLYRSELASAQERVRQLEEELRLRGGPRKRPPRPLTNILLGVGISVVGMSLAAVMVVRGFSHPTKIDDVTPPPPISPIVTPPSLHGAQWYTPMQGAHKTPILMDVNGDGTNDVVGLAWNASDDEHALHAVAFDGKSYQMLWHSEGISTQWYSEKTSIRRDGESLIVTDSRNEVRTIDARTGKVTNLTLGPNAKTIDPDPQDDHHDDLRRAAPTAKKKGFYSSEAHPSGEIVATIGWVDGSDNAEWMMGFKKSTKAIVYEVPLLGANDARAPRSEQMRTVDAERVYTAFVSSDTKQVRIVARSLTTGEVAFRTDMHGYDEGAQFRSMSSEDGRVFLAVDGALLVLDASTGHENARLNGF